LAAVIIGILMPLILYNGFAEYNVGTMGCRAMMIIDILSNEGNSLEITPLVPFVWIHNLS
jgi:hypothetical protein